MSLTPFTGTVTEAVLNANFDDARAAITSQATAGQVDACVTHRKLTLTSTPAVADFVDFTPEDDMEVRVLRVFVESANAGSTITATLSVANGDSTFLVDKTLTASVTSIAGTVQATTDLRTVTGTRVRLLRGVPYRLALSASSSTHTAARATVLLRTIRRVT